LLPLAPDLQRAGFPIVIRQFQANGFGAAQPRAVQQGQDGRIARRHGRFLPVVVLAGGEQRANFARLQRPSAWQARTVDWFKVGRALKILGGDIAEAPALLEHAAQRGQVAICRRGRVTAVGEQRPHCGGVAVTQLGPVERPGVTALVAQETGDGVQSGAHGAPRRRRQPGQVHGDGMAVERNLVQDGELMPWRVFVSRRVIVGEANRGGYRRKHVHTGTAEIYLFISYLQMLLLRQRYGY
jgi:hypothetical protein